MEAFLLVPEAEWKQVLARLSRLEEGQPPREEKPTDEILNVRQAAALLGMKPDGLRKARRQGRVKGVRLNEKEWGFYTSELRRYQNRYNRSPI